jgi:transposase
VLILKKKGIKESGATGDGTGYLLTIKKNYESYTRELKERAKEAGNEKSASDNNASGHETVHKKKLFAYSFRLMDLGTRMYIAFGSSLKSEKEAFNRAMRMLRRTDITLKSVRLDKYYSVKYVSKFGKGTKVYIIPKKNATLNGSQKWKDR